MMSVRASIDQPNAVATSLAIPSPSAIPMIPPIAASVSDSTRNCARAASIDSLVIPLT
jgi:hypothetical protein